jgi:hypothetical protein
MQVPQFYTFLQQNNISNFDLLKTFLENDPYKLKIKEDTKYPTLCIIINGDESNINEPIVRFCNGIILDKESLKIICYTFIKCMEENTINPELFTGNLYIEPSYEGTLIRVFHYNNEWFFSTKKMINARRAKWVSSKSFFDLFQETLPNPNIDEYLDKTKCYSFLLIHHENNVVIRYPKNNIIHISTFDSVNQCECEATIDHGIMKSIRQPISFQNQEEFMNYVQALKNDKNIDNEGIMFINNNYVRQKFKKDLYVFIRNLWGNTNSRFYRYLELRKNPSDIQNYLIYFEKDKILFSNYEEKIGQVALEIYNLYATKYISKTEGTKIPYYLKDFIYAIHGNFLKTRVKVKHEDIMIYILSLDAAKFCYIINQMKKDKETAEKKDGSSMEIIPNESTTNVVVASNESTPMAI